MVGSVNNGFQPQIPAAQTFKSGEQNQNLLNNKPESRLSGDVQTSSLKTTTSAPDQTEQINSKVALSRDNTRPDPNNISSSVNRGSTLDISV